MNLETIIKYLKTQLPEDQIKEHSNYFSLPTICHNPSWEGASHKLYLYKNEATNSPLFHCFTECAETFNIYKLIQKIEEAKGNKISFKQAYQILNGKEFQAEKKEESLLSLPLRFQNPLDIELPIYPENSLNLFSFDNLSNHPWYLEGIDEPTLIKYEVYYSKSYDAVIIPHRDWRGNLVGIRVRNFDPLKVDKYKYIPFSANGISFRHPVGMNLYGLYQNYESIQKYKTVYIFEGEKSVLQASHMFKHDLSLAVCGNKISEWQMKVLIYYLGVEKIYICFDKEYSSYGEAFDYIEKIKNQTRFLQNFADIYVAIDDKNNFNLKESPVDRTKKEFENLNFRQV